MSLYVSLYGEIDDDDADDCFKFDDLLSFENNTATNAPVLLLNVTG